MKWMEMDFSYFFGLQSECGQPLCAGQRDLCATCKDDFEVIAHSFFRSAQL
jgi:hypothetical protein